MKKLNLKKAKFKPNPIFDGLPEKLKNPAMFAKVELELFKILQSDHKHKTVKEYVICAWCNKKRELRQNKIKSLGFQSINQYFEWKKVMLKIQELKNLKTT